MSQCGQHTPEDGDSVYRGTAAWAPAGVMPARVYHWSCGNFGRLSYRDHLGRAWAVLGCDTTLPALQSSYGLWLFSSSHKGDHRSSSILGFPSFLGPRYIVGHTLQGCAHTPLSSPTMHLPTILPTRAVQGCRLGGEVDPLQAHPLVLSTPHSLIFVLPPKDAPNGATSDSPEGWLKDRCWSHPPNFWISRFGWGLHFALHTESQVMLMVLVWDHIFQNCCCGAGQIMWNGRRAHACGLASVCCNRISHTRWAKTRIYSLPVLEARHLKSRCHYGEQYGGSLKN